MDFLDPRKKRAHKIRLYTGYFLMSIAIGVSTFILMYSAYGFGIDRKTGNVIQNGLIIMDSHPVSASINVNGTKRGTTNSRLVLPNGQYNIELTANGYRSWKQYISLDSGNIEQLVYPYLFPTNLVSKTIAEYPSDTGLYSSSPDKHWLVVHVPGTTATFNIIDMSNSKATVQLVNLPADSFTPTGQSHKYEAIEWASDNSSLLLHHMFEGGSEFVMLNRDSITNSVNVTKTFSNQPFTNIVLRDKKPDQLLLFNSQNGILSQADINTKAVNPVLSKVLAFKSFQSDTILYVTSQSGVNNTSVEVRVMQDGRDYLLKVIPAAPNYLLDIANFSNHVYLAVGSGADGKTYLYKDPFSDFKRHPARTPLPYRVLIVPGGKYISFSDIARFVAVQSGNKFGVYDIETDRQYKYDTKLSVDDLQKATWMDGHRLMLVSDNKVNIFDFDGTNNQSLVSAYASHSAAFDKDYNGMYTLSPSTSSNNKFVILRTDLKAQ